MTRGDLLIRAEGTGIVRQGRQVLHDVHLEVFGGEVLALVGPNGGGKTTLIQVLLGVMRPDAGAMTWFDEKGRGHPDPQRTVGYVPQHKRADLRFPLTVCEVVGMTLRRGRPLWHRFSKEDHRKVHQALERMGIGHLAGRFVGRLSGGQQQRLFLARALVHEPELLVLDEPTTGIDARGRDEMLELIRRLRDAAGVGIVLATHEERHIAALANRSFAVDGTVAPLAVDTVTPLPAEGTSNPHVRDSSPARDKNVS